MGRPETRGTSQPRRLTIGLPVYNGEQYLAQSLDSLLAQTFTDFTLVISDNGSTDGTAAICRSYAQRDARIQYHRSDINRGAAWNFNRVFELAESPYFKWAAYDDLCAAEFVERCIEVLDRNPQVIVAYPQSFVIDDDGEIIATYRDPADATSSHPHLRFHAVVRNSGNCHLLFGVIRRDILARTQLHGAYPASDVILIAELALRGELHEVGERLFYWRDHRRRPQRLYSTDAELAVFYDPRNAGTVPMRHVALLAGYVHTLMRVPLPAAERARCALVVCKWATLRLRVIGAELARRVVTAGQRSRRTPSESVKGGLDA
jgi:glycosyltransferase involved in cell wall biosynthesis